MASEINLTDFRHLTEHQGHRSRRIWRRVKNQVWHRSSLHTHFGRGIDDPDLRAAVQAYGGTDPSAFAHIWEFPDMGTGGKVPYHCLVKRNGDIWWLVPWKKVAPGAAPVNDVSYNIAVEGDFRYRLPAFPQWRACRDLCHFLAAKHGVRKVYGHTEIAPSTKDPSKVCPGGGLSIETLKTIARSA